MNVLVKKLERLEELIARAPRREICSRAEACILLGLPRKKLDRMISLGEITAYPLGTKRRGGVFRGDITRHLRR